jgi:hypothetical protein
MMIIDPYRFSVPYYLYDTFTETSDTELSLHTPNIGTSWSQWLGGAIKATVNAAGAWISGDNIGTPSGYVLTDELPDPDYEVRYTQRWSSFVIWGGGVTFRSSLDGATRYFVLQNGGNLEVWKTSSGDTQIGSYDLSGNGYNTADFYNMKIVVNGTSIKVYINDVLRIDITDSTITAAGRVGFAATSFVYIKNFRVALI